MRGIGCAIAEFGDVDELVVDDGWPDHGPVADDATRLGRSVALDKRGVEHALDEVDDLGRDRRRPGHGELCALEVAAPHRGEGVGVRITLDAFDFGQILLVQHLPDTRHEVQFGRRDGREVVEEFRQVRPRGEVGGSTVAERSHERRSAHHVTHRQEVQGDPGVVFARVVFPCGTVCFESESLSDQPKHCVLSVHGPLRRAGTAGGVDQQREVVGLRVAADLQCLFGVVGDRRLGVEVRVVDRDSERFQQSARTFDGVECGFGDVEDDEVRKVGARPVLDECGDPGQRVRRHRKDFGLGLVEDISEHGIRSP